MWPSPSTPTIVSGVYTGAFDSHSARRWAERDGTYDAIFATIDFMPTFASLAGFDVPSDRRVDGVDQTPLLLGKRETGREYFYFHDAGVRQGKWKYLKPNAAFHNYAIDSDRAKVDELYDLESDLGERTNLAAKFPRKVAELKALMTSIEDDDRLDPSDNLR